MQSDNHEVSRDAVYSELYEEMRRYRDYELTASTWYTAILVGILGSIIAAKFLHDGSPSQLAEVLAQNSSFRAACDYLKQGQIAPAFVLIQGYLFKLAIAAIVFIVGVASIHSIHYAHVRHEDLRSYTNHMEPIWKRFSLQTPIWRPRHWIYLMQLLITFATTYLVLIPTSNLSQATKDSTILCDAKTLGGSTIAGIVCLLVIRDEIEALRKRITKKILSHRPRVR